MDRDNLSDRGVLLVLGERYFDLQDVGILLRLSWRNEEVRLLIGLLYHALLEVLPWQRGCHVDLVYGCLIRRHTVLARDSER